MSGGEGLIVGLGVIAVAFLAVCLLGIGVVIEHLKDLKAWHWTVMGRLDALRDEHLKILKCLKGESYQGSYCGMDVHTDPNIPPGVGLMFNRQALTRLGDE